jgi:hypothetical protein
MDPQPRLQIAERINAQLLLQLDLGVDPRRMLTEPLYLRDVLLVCDAHPGSELATLARQYRAELAALAAARAAKDQPAVAAAAPAKAAPAPARSRPEAVRPAQQRSAMSRFSMSLFGASIFGGSLFEGTIFGGSRRASPETDFGGDTARNEAPRAPWFSPSRWLRR